jgi:hypothetical protein
VRRCIIFPAMIVPGSGAGDNININTAHATVSMPRRRQCG